MSSRIFTLNPTYTHWYFKQWVCGHKNSQIFRATLMISRILFCHLDACHCFDKDINSGFLTLITLWIFPILIKMDYFFNENESHQETDRLLFNVLFSHLEVGSPYGMPFIIYKVNVIGCYFTFLQPICAELTLGEIMTISLRLCFWSL